MKVAHQQRGQGAVEFMVVFVLFLALLGGLFEMTRVIRCKLLLRSATFEAARVGAMHHARRAPMEAELANGMTALQTFGARGPEGLVAAQARARALVSAPGIGIRILHPTAALHTALARSQWIHLDGDDAYAWAQVIPNDNLQWRPRDSVTIADGTEVHLQDANLLKVASVWCHRLVVPALDRLIHAVVTTPAWASDRQSPCTALSSGPDRPDGIAAGYYLAVTGTAIVRMQSAVVDDDLS